jgi:hypothetical protein
MKKIIILLVLTGGLAAFAYCQSEMIVKKNEIIQILDRFQSLSGLPGHFSGQVYVAKLVKESKFDEYSFVITSISYVEEIPNDSLYYIVIEGKCFIIARGNDISLNKKEFDSTSFFCNNIEILKNVDHFFHDRGVVISFPTIMIFKVREKNCLLNNRMVQFETIHPIENISKKYWPVENWFNAKTNTPFFTTIDKSNKALNTYKTYLETGKGKFRIKTQ